MVTICIPTFNRAADLALAIASARAQTFRDIEILVVDNHSTDGTEALVRELAAADPRIRLVRQAENVGLTRNFSACIAQARGELVKFICDDDALEPQCVARLVEAFESRPGIALAVCARRLVDRQQRPFRVVGARTRSCVIDGEAMVRELFVRGNTIGEPSAVLFRRDDAQGGFDERYEQAVDLEMWARLLRKGALAFVAEPLCRVRVHDAQATRRNILVGRVIEDKRRLFRELLPTLAGRLSLFERWRWDLRMASTIGRMRAAGSAPPQAVAEVFHPRLFRALAPLAAIAWSIAR